MVWDQVPITMVAIDRKIGDFTATLRALVDHWLLSGGVEVFFGGTQFIEKVVRFFPRVTGAISSDECAERVNIIGG